jgi:hypothetical protein
VLQRSDIGNPKSKTPMALQGDLSEFGLVDIIQLIDLGKKTGGVEIHGARGGETLDGWVFFNEGKICAAQLGPLTGEEAAYTLFTCSAGPFKLHEGMPLPAPNIGVSNEVVIMEGIGRQDEWASIAERVPPKTTVMKLVPNPRSSSREINLEADKWRVLTMINGKNTVADIARLSGLGDYATFKIIVELMDAGLIDGKAQAPVSAPVYPDLERLAVAGIGNSARMLLADAFRRAGLRPEDRSAPQQQMLQAIMSFEQSTTLLLGPSRARTLADQLRARIQQAS